METKHLFLMMFFLLPMTSLDCQNIGKNFYLKGIEALSSNYDSSVYLFKKALLTIDKDVDRDIYIDCYNGLFAANYFRGQFIESKNSLLKGLEEVQKNNFDTSWVYVDILNNLGMLYSAEGQIKKAIVYIKKSLTIDENSTDTYVTLANLARQYQKLHDYKQAQNYFNQALKTLMNKDNYDKLFEGMLYSFFGEIFLDIKSPEKALSFLEEGLRIELKYQKGDAALEETIDYYNSIVKCFLLLNKLDSAEIIIQKALKIHETPTIQFRYLTYNALGKLREQQKKYDLAKQAYRRAIKEIHIQLFEFEIHNVITWQYRDLAKLEYKLNELTPALKTAQKGLSHIATNVHLDDLFSNPKIKDFVYKPEGLEILTIKAQILQKRFEEKGDLQDLEAAFATYQLASELAKRMRQDIMTQGSKQKLAGEVLPVYEGGIETALLLFEKTKDPNYQKAAFAFAESNKAILLLESINEKAAQQYGGIPDTLLEKEKDLRIEIAFYDKSINQEKAKKENPDEEKIKQWESTLFELESDYQRLITNLEENYPRYYELKYETKLASVEELQKQILSPTDVILEYFVGERNIYTFAITKDELYINSTPKAAELEEQIETFLYHTQRPAQGGVDYRLTLNTQYEFFQELLAPSLQQLPSSTKRLIIIPDDVLNYIPFELLIQQPAPQDTIIFHPYVLDYLFEDYQITYNYSASLLLKSFEEQSKPKAKYSLLAMAPKFQHTLASNSRSCDIQQIYNLSCSEDEATSIASLLNGKAMVGYQADTASFYQLAKDYQILHLATHSCPDEENPMMNKIFLADEAITNYDLYNMNLQADLAVLSACNTGFGKLVKGEGVMPLSKGFIYAGVPSTIMSLWPVDDCSASRMMTLFYKHLKEGLDKDEALQKAKLDFMNQSTALHQHPYYWAPFIQMGNFKPLPSTSSWGGYWWAVLIGGMLLLFGGRFVFRRA